MVSDPFDTAAMRRRVLDAWEASPARFREDANAEEDLVRGGYRDRVLVELAANAADAAAATGVPGRLRLALDDGVLVAANVGAPLDAAGVESLSTLRASSKRDDQPQASRDSTAGGHPVGRFGVGFAAVLAVTDEPRISSRTGGVRWSTTETGRLVAQLSGTDEELIRRAGVVPVLRLPFPDGPVEDGPWDTVVMLPLRDEVATTLARRLLLELDAALLLTLPALASVEVDLDGVRRRIVARRDRADVVIEDDTEVTRWQVAGRSGPVDPAVVADRPVEERSRPSYAVTWALPVDVTGRPAMLPSTVPAVVHAPTPTDEPMGLPALLIASLPLDPSRRHVAPGALRDHVIAEAAATYVELIGDLVPDPSVLDLVPQGLAEGAVDAELRRGILELLPETPFLDETRLRPRDALVVDASPAAVAVLLDVLPGLLTSQWAVRAAPLAVLGVRLLTLADLSDDLGGLDRPPGWWRELYAALATGHLGAPERDALGTMPVPLADGRLVNGPRGLLVPTGEVDPEALAGLGLRVVHPDAAHPLLTLLGALDATAQAVLDQGAVHAAVAASYDDEDSGPVADAVMTLVAAAGVQPGESPWLADLSLPATDGDSYPAGELLLPGGALSGVVLADAPFGVVADDVVARWSRDVLTAVGVLDTFALARDDDAIGPEHDLDREADWWSQLGQGASVPEFVAVRDLEFVDPERWDAALALLAEPPLRDAVTEPTVALAAGGAHVRVPSYTAWWLSVNPVLDGRRPRDLVMDADLVGLYDAAPARLDREFLNAIGVRSDLAAVVRDADGVADLLQRLADPERDVDRALLARLHAALAGSAVSRDVAPPDRVRAVRAGEVVVVDAEDAVVVDAPDLLPLVAERAVAPVAVELAAQLADVLALPVASELASYDIVSTGHEHDDHVAHDPLLVSDAAGRETRVPWRVVDGVLHVDRERRAFGRGRGQAWLAGQWQRRHLFTALLSDGEDAAELLAECDLDPGA